MTHRVIQLWDPVLRLLHWIIAFGFVCNYWVLSQGDFWHRVVGYCVFICVLVRVIWGLIGPSTARFSGSIFQLQHWQHHFHQLKQRQIDPQQGHNPFGFAWLYLSLTLFSLLAISGFLLEEVDYFFGNDLLEWCHGFIADTLFVFVCIHLSAVLLLQWWGKIALIKPMLTGKRNF